MTDTDIDAQRIHHDWHAAVVARDLDALMALYAPDAILETPLIVVTLPEHGSGVLHGKTAIAAFFAAGLRDPRNQLGRWYRTDQFFSNGRQLIWEYPRATPDGDQVDLVEVMDLRDGLIAHHRVYWGWAGFNALRSAAPADGRA
ncbi:nuclear transport factor 2 family protein [Burkholderia vietnamiensis]|uniref:nuclear transport factor 2 family protein n=1 Tax=Burkholderia vietnamiensis TaxID=60552 RepID=UPI000754D3B1|nr:nuclear transport factor 2 family protein [Burkholderia vietnamiensis]KVE05091.1 polyketide cyclase [Burkholderia vietnamiensis]KVF27448.1 polyketide cyclase [Burkholderia vietnamiensis]KVF36028.1 polyketide cyclase [Burkholderia vietnamiensis]KVF75131.1 polyketide cyclase [Burkholderia vietnamiensis]KVF85241.1 polyketide cyclase [Burkholderia vietnamiensis]